MEPRGFPTPPLGLTPSMALNSSPSHNLALTPPSLGSAGRETPSSMESDYWRVVLGRDQPTSELEAVRRELQQCKQTLEIEQAKCVQPAALHACAPAC